MRSGYKYTVIYIFDGEKLGTEKLVFHYRDNLITCHSYDDSKNI